MDHADLEGSWTTQWERSLRNEPTQLRKLPDIDRPKEISSRLCKILWSTVSKVALSSNNANRVSCELSTAPCILQRRQSKRVLVECPLRKQDWHSWRNSFISK